MELELQGVLQEKEILEIRGNGKSEIESMIVYDANLKESIENCGERIAGDGIEKNKRIRNCKNNKKEKEDDDIYIHVYNG